MCGDNGEAAARLRPSERSEWLKRFVICHAEKCYALDCCFNGANSKQKTHANQEMKMTASIHATFSPPWVLSDLAIIMRGMTQNKASIRKENKTDIPMTLPCSTV